MGRREIETLDRQTWAVWDSTYGIVADVIKLAPRRWCVEEYYTGVCAYFRTQRQAIHYANQLPCPSEAAVSVTQFPKLST